MFYFKIQRRKISVTMFRKLTRRPWSCSNIARLDDFARGGKSNVKLQRRLAERCRNLRTAQENMPTFPVFSNFGNLTPPNGQNLRHGRDKMFCIWRGDWAVNWRRCVTASDLKNNSGDYFAIGRCCPSTSIEKIRPLWGAGLLSSMTPQKLGLKQAVKLFDLICAVSEKIAAT